jgi:hypothetical protein
MDASIAQSVNDRYAAAIAARFDENDIMIPIGAPWYQSEVATGILDTYTDDNRELAMRLVAGCVNSGEFDGAPADGDWEYLTRRFQDEIQRRRINDQEVVATAT